MNGHFEGKRGLRQGDPLSLILFTLVMKVLSRLLKVGAQEKVFDFHPRCRRTKLTNRCFTDDVMIFTKGDLQSLQGVVNIMSKFTTMIGLEMNLNKSIMMLGNVQGLEAKMLSTDIGINLEVLPIKYLGLPLCAGRIGIKECLQLLEKITRRIRMWHS